MIPQATIQAWSTSRPWPTLAAVEQDLLLARLIVAAFGPYRPDGFTGALAEANLRTKLDDGGFRNDLNGLVAKWPADYDLDSAADLVITELLARLDGSR